MLRITKCYQWLFVLYEFCEVSPTCWQTSNLIAVNNRVLNFSPAISFIGQLDTCDASQLNQWVILAKDPSCYGSNVTAWALSAVASLGSLVGEYVWCPYVRWWVLRVRVRRLAVDHGHILTCEYIDNGIRFHLWVFSSEDCLIVGALNISTVSLVVVWIMDQLSLVYESSGVYQLGFGRLIPGFLEMGSLFKHRKRAQSKSWG